jgi:hypothetical protein
MHEAPRSIDRFQHGGKGLVSVDEELETISGRMAFWSARVSERLYDAGDIRIRDPARAEAYVRAYGRDSRCHPIQSAFDSHAGSDSSRNALLIDGILSLRRYASGEWVGIGKIL